MLWFTLVLFIVGESVAQVTILRSCPAPATVPNFNLTAYMGRWFEVRKYLDLSEVGDKCVTVKYTLSEDGSFKIKKKQIPAGTDKETSIDGLAIPMDNSNDAKFTVIYVTLDDVIEEQYWVLATDYDNWAIVWGCEDSGKSRSIRQSSILTRKRKPRAEVLEKISDALEKARISTIFFAETVQKDCSKSH